VPNIRLHYSGVVTTAQYLCLYTLRLNRYTLIPDRYKLLRLYSETSDNAGKCLRKVAQLRATYI
jgi:hypothetical protein